MRNVLLIGATGVFGQRLARHLANFDGISLVLASRDTAKAEKLCSQIQATNPQTRVKALALDTNINLPKCLAELRPWLVIDASGPFQSAGYSVPRGAIEQGAHYLDLADARQYLGGFNALDEIAKAANVVALAGASSTPALSSAVIAKLTNGWTQIDSVDIAIVPGGKSEVGPAVIKAILSYAGKPIPALTNGSYGSITAWINSQILHVEGLGKRRIAPVETADVELVAPHFKVQKRLLFQAGLESPIEQWGIIALSHFRRFIPNTNLTILTPLLQFARKLTRILTGDVGAMIVSVQGLNGEGQVASAKWTLIAKNGDGPNVPVMAAAAAVKAILNGALSSGARACINEIPLEEIEAEMKRYAIETSIRVVSP